MYMNCWIHCCTSGRLRSQTYLLGRFSLARNSCALEGLMATADFDGAPLTAAQFGNQVSKSQLYNWSTMTCAGTLVSGSLKGQVESIESKGAYHMLWGGVMHSWCAVLNFRLFFSVETRRNWANVGNNDKRVKWETGMLYVWLNVKVSLVF